MRFKNNLERVLFGNGCILLATIFWGINYPFTKALAPEWMSANAISAVRLVGGAILFWVVSLFLKAEKLDRESLHRCFLGGVIGLFGCIFLFVASLNYGSPIDISIIMTLPPVYVVLIQVIFMKKRPPFMEYCGLLLSFAGAVMVILAGSSSTHSASNYLLGDTLALISALCFAIYLLALAKPDKHYKPISLLRWVFLFSALPGLFLVPSLLEAPLLHSSDAIPWLEIGFILLCPTFISYLLVQPANNAIGTEMVALYQYLTPVVAAIAAMLMGVDKPTWSQGIAMLIIVVGMSLTNRAEKKSAA